jgi:hypothetical protein
MFCDLSDERCDLVVEGVGLMVEGSALDKCHHMHKSKSCGTCQIDSIPTVTDVGLLTRIYDWALTGA